MRRSIWRRPPNPRTRPLRHRNAASFATTAVGKSVSLLWDQHTAVGDSVQLLWDIREVVPDQLGGYLWAFAGADFESVTTPHHASLDITGDIDLRAFIRPDTWTGIDRALIAKSDVSSFEEVYSFWLTSTGKLQIVWQDPIAGSPQRTSTDSVNFVSATPKWVRATLDVDNGASGHTARFYTSDDGSSWSQLGADVVNAPVLAGIDTSTDPLSVGSSFGLNAFQGRIYYAEVRNGIAGTVVANPDFRDKSTYTSPSTLVDSTAKTWTVDSSALLVPPGTLDLNWKIREVVPDRLGGYYGASSGQGSGASADTPDHASLDITGDIDLRVFIRPDDWTPAYDYALIARSDSFSSNEEYAFWLTTTGHLVISWLSSSSFKGQTSSVPVVLADGVSKWVRATLDVDDGAGNYIVRFYTSDDGSSWDQLGDDMGEPETSSIDAGANPLSIGTSFGLNNFKGRIYYAEVRNGIAGTVVANPDFRDKSTYTSPTSLIDSTAKTWTVNSPAILVSPGTLDLNWKIREVVPDQLGGYYQGGVAGTAQVPQHSDLDISGDIDLRVLVRMPASDVSGTLITKSALSELYTLYLHPSGILQLAWDDWANQLDSTASLGVAPGGLKWLRATLDVDNGASGHTVRFYTSDDGSSWSQLGADVVGSGTTSIPTASAPILLGGYGVAGNSFLGRIYYAEVRNGIAGTVVANPDFRNKFTYTSPSTLVDSTGKVWTVNSPGVLVPPGTLDLRWEVHHDLPVVVSVTASQFNTNSTNLAVAMPATVDPGDLLMMIISTDENSDLTTPTGWERLRTVSTVTACRLTAYAKRAFGNEDGTTVNITIAAAQDGAAHVFRIINYSGFPVAATIASNTSNATVNPPPTQPNWGTRDVLFIVATAVDGDVSASTWPSGYTDNQLSTESGAGDANGASIITATRGVLNEANTEDPATFSLDATAAWNCLTFALRGPVKSDDIGFANFIDVTGSTVSTPDVAALDITGDIDIRVLALVSERGQPRHQNFITKGNPGNASGSWVFRQQNSATTLAFSWRDAGGNLRTATSSGGVTINGVATWYRVTLDVDNGSGQYDVSFYSSSEAPSTNPDSVTWSLVNTVTGSTGTSSINSGDQAVWLGNRSDDANERLFGDIMYAEVRDGIAGSKVLNVDFRTRDQYVHASELADDFRTWTIVSPAKWYFPVEAVGITAVGDSIQFVWDQRSLVTDDVTLRWDIFTTIGDPVSLLWDLRQLVSDSIQFLWDLRFALGDPLTLRWDQRSLVTDNISLLWDLRQLASDSIQFLWDLRFALGDPLTLRWDQKFLVTDDVILRWDLRFALGDPLTLRWDQFTFVGDSISFEWDIRQLATDSIELLWDLRFALGDPLTLRWDQFTALGDSIELLWDLRFALGDPLTLRWDIFTAIADTLELVWDVEATATVGDPIQFLWDIRSLVTDDVSFEWDIFTTIGDPVQFIWDLRQLATDSIQFLWDLRFAQSDDISFLWDVSGSVGDTLSLLWDQFTVIGDSIQFLWDISQLASDDISLLWDLRQLVSDSISLLWDLRFAQSDDISFLWDVRAAVGDAIELLWDVIAIGAVGDEISLQWDIHQNVSDTIALLWDILANYAYLRPVGTISNDGWDSGPTTGLDLWDQIDEEMADDEDYIWVTTS